MAEHPTYDLVVIGGGPAGYAGAIRAGQLGRKVACIELERAGGTCLNWGCIPTKALLQAAGTLESIRGAGAFGLKTGPVEVDFGRVMQRSREVADRMGKGIEFLFKKNKVDYFLGRAHVPVPGMVEITEGRDRGRYFNTRHTLIATGCRARQWPELPVDGEKVLTSREALALRRQPASIIILGAGAIGVEFAYFLRTLGSEVTLVEMMPRILPVEDEEISAALARSFAKQGIQVHTGVKAENLQSGPEGVRLDVVGASSRQTLTAECVLLSIGVEPNLGGVFSNKVRPELVKGYLRVDDRYQTTVPGIYAAGDIIGPPWLAHVATFEAVQAVQGMFGHGTPRRVTIYPGCTYCHPQVASVGLTEQAARERKIEYKVGRFPFAASGKAVAINAAEGFVKLILGARHGEILGAHILGPEATELIAEYVLAMSAELTAEEIHHTIHAHPTLTEALAEAAANASGEAIHV